MEQINELLLNFLVSILTLGLGLLLAYASTYVKRMSQALQAKTNHALVEGVIQRVERMALKAVTALEQESGSLIRQAVKAGNITKEDGRSQLKDLANDAYMRVLNEVGAEGVNVLEEQFIEVEQLIRDSIEEAVARLKSPLSIGS